MSTFTVDLKTSVNFSKHIFVKWLLDDKSNRVSTCHICIGHDLVTRRTIVLLLLFNFLLLKHGNLFLTLIIRCTHRIISVGKFILRGTTMIKYEKTSSKKIRGSLDISFFF